MLVVAGAWQLFLSVSNVQGRPLYGDIFGLICSECVTKYEKSSARAAPSLSREILWIYHHVGDHPERELESTQLKNGGRRIVLQVKTSAIGRPNVDSWAIVDSLHV